MRFIRAIFAMQTVAERALAEQRANARAIFDAERALLSKRSEIVYLRKRNAHLASLTGVAA